MPEPTADRDLLFGVLAVQMQLVSHDELASLSSRAVAEPGQSLSALLLAEKRLSADEIGTVESAVEAHLKRHGYDVRRCLESIAVYDSVNDSLACRTENDALATLGHPSADRDFDDTHATVLPTDAPRTDARERFSILRLHQKGGLGRVSIALDEELHREIALKEILPAHADNRENRTRFVREAEITGALEHPGVVPVYSLGQFADGRPYYAMRFIRGMNLQDALEDFHREGASLGHQQLGFLKLLGRFISVCYAIEYAHSRGVIHRDIKPGNIMLGAYGETLVVDWGLAKTLSDGVSSEESTLSPVSTSDRASSKDTQVGRVVGTPSYMSPEQAAGRLSALGPASDVYCLGATLYHMLTGEAPFRGTEEEVLGKVQLGRFRRPRQLKASIPRALEAICLKAMALLPRERYASARELAEDLERYLADERVLAYVEPLPAKAWRWIRNHKVLVTSTAAALVVAATTLSILVFFLSAANVRERALTEQANRSFEEADEQREIAERNFALARDAVREYYVAVSEETLLDQPGMHQLRDRLLRQALTYYQKFLEQRQNDPALREEVAQARYLAGSITQVIDSPALAIPHFEQAAQLQKRLLADASKSQSLRTAYGQTLNAMGGAQLRLGQFDAAEKSFQQAVEVREAVAKGDPEDAEAARTLANSVMNLGSLYLMQQEFGEAIPILERAQMIRMAHVTNLDAADSKMQRDLGKGYYQLALARLREGDMVLAEANFLKASELFAMLVGREPNDSSHIRNLAACQRMVGDLNSSEGQTETAVEFYRQAQASLEELTRRDPDVQQYAFDLALLDIKLGEHLEAEEAVEAMRRAVALLAHLTERAPTVPGYSINYGKALRGEGRLLIEAGQTDLAAERLDAAQQVFSQLVKEDGSDEQYTTQLQQTLDDQARLAAAREETP